MKAIAVCIHYLLWADQVIYRCSKCLLWQGSLQKGIHIRFMYHLKCAVQSRYTFGMLGSDDCKSPISSLQNRSKVVFPFYVQCNSLSTHIVEASVNSAPLKCSANL